MTALLQEIVTLLVSGLNQFAVGFGQGVVSLVSAIMLDTTEAGSPKLNVTGGIIVIFAGVSLCIGLSRWVMNLVSSLGARNR